MSGERPEWLRDAAAQVERQHRERLAEDQAAEPTTGDVSGWRTNHAGLTTLVNSLVKRPGGWSVPVWATCSGHETGAAFKLRADGTEVEVRVNVGSYVTIPLDGDFTPALLLTCRKCGRKQLRVDDLVTEAMVRALVAWKASGGMGRVRFKWS